MFRIPFIDYCPINSFYTGNEEIVHVKSKEGMGPIAIKGEVVRESVWDQVKNSRVDINNKLDTEHRLV